MPIEPDEIISRQNQLRYFCGVSCSFLAATVLGWPLGFLCAVLIATLTAQPAPLPARVSLRLTIFTATLLAVAIVFSGLMLRYPVVFLVGQTLVLFQTFRFSLRGGNPLFTLMALIAFLLTPSLSFTDNGLSISIAIWITVNLALALCITQLLFWMFPAVPVKNPAPAPAIPAKEIDLAALKILGIVMPLLVFLQATGSSKILMLIFVALLVQQLCAAKTRMAGRAMLMSNTAGGVLAILSFEVMVIAPSLAVFTALTLFTLLALSRLIWSNWAYAGLVGSAATAYLVLYGGALVPFGENIDGKLLGRLWQIGLAVAYVFATTSLLEWFENRKAKRPAHQQAN